MELAESLAGLRRPSAGSILLDGQDITGASVAARVAAGMAYMPADRSSTALAPGFTIADNLMLRDKSPSSLRARAFLGAGQSAATGAPVDA
jgi:simple sugar transport system ATP-binding protein